MNNDYNFIQVLIVLGIAFFIYLIPYYIANSRKHHNAGAILMVNLLLGWTALGWVAALVWAMTAVKEPEVKATLESDKKCPFCAETIKLAAIVCRHCGRDLPTQAPDTPIPEPDALALMEKYGITYQDEKYHYKEHRYADLRDAVNYAKAQVENDKVVVC